MRVRGTDVPRDAQLIFFFLLAVIILPFLFPRPFPFCTEREREREREIITESLTTATPPPNSCNIL